ncbi:MAG TPA: hypothetical protein VF145_11725, partial [Chitinophagaceae bacterium]
LMLMAERKLGKRYSLQLAAGWQMQSFSSHRTIYKDSMAAGSAIPVILLEDKSGYRLHSMNVFTGAEYRLLNKTRLSLSIGAGIDNRWIIGARVLTTASGSSPVATSESLQKGTSGYYKWQPQMELHLSAGMPVGKTRIECTPWFRQGWKQLQKGNGNAANYMMSYGLRTAFFIR